MQCKECNIEFTPLIGNTIKGYGKFCSKECLYKYRSKAMKSGEYKCPHPKKIYTFTCITCGKEFTRTGHTAHRNKYCSPECVYKNRLGKKHPRYNQEEVSCIQCGKQMMRSPCYTKSKWGNFCSPECKATWQSENIKGADHPQWLGGKSFEPYCPLFNDTFKERVRFFFDNKCVICGNPSNGEKLHVHHVEYNKLTCCDDSPKMFVALCRSCHTKTNHNREAYAKQFCELIDTKYKGRSYFTVEEWDLLNQS